MFGKFLAQEQSTQEVIVQEEEPSYASSFLPLAQEEQPKRLAKQGLLLAPLLDFGGSSPPLSQKGQRSTGPLLAPLDAEPSFHPLLPPPSSPPNTLSPCSSAPSTPPPPY